jgi:hypothetical protein
LSFETANDASDIFDYDRMMRTAAWVALIASGVSALVAAQVPVSQEPRHKVAFENALFRILNVNVPPKDTTLDHKHELDFLSVSMTNGTDTRVQSPGQPWSDIRPRRPLGHIQVTEYSGKPASHRLENVGDGAYHLFAVENLKTNGWSTTPALSSPATKLAQESRSFRAYTVSLGRDRQQTSHTHAVPTIVVLMSGKVLSDGPSEKAKQNAPAAVGLKQLDGIGQWLLVPAGDTHHLVRLGAEDGQLVEIEVR